MDSASVDLGPVDRDTACRALKEIFESSQRVLALEAVRNQTNFAAKAAKQAWELAAEEHTQLERRLAAEIDPSREPMPLFDKPRAEVSQPTEAKKPSETTPAAQSEPKGSELFRPDATSLVYAVSHTGKPPIYYVRAQSIDAAKEYVTRNHPIGSKLDVTLFEAEVPVGSFFVEVQGVFCVLDAAGKNPSYLVVAKDLETAREWNKKEHPADGEVVVPPKGMKLDKTLTFYACGSPPKETDEKPAKGKRGKKAEAIDPAAAKEIHDTLCPNGPQLPPDLVRVAAWKDIPIAELGLPALLASGLKTDGLKTAGDLREALAKDPMEPAWLEELDGESTEALWNAIRKPMKAWEAVTIGALHLPDAMDMALANGHDIITLGDLRTALSDGESLQSLGFSEIAETRFRELMSELRTRIGWTEEEGIPAKWLEREAEEDAQQLSPSDSAILDALYIADGIARWDDLIAKGATNSQIVGVLGELWPAKPEATRYAMIQGGKHPTIWLGTGPVKHGMHEARGIELVKRARLLLNIPQPKADAARPSHGRPARAQPSSPHSPTAP
jgi:hypothetical protein